MTTTDYRALCAELAGCLDDALTFTVQGDTERSMRQLVARARELLSQPPEPAEGPSDEELHHAYQAAYQPAWEKGEWKGAHYDGLRAVLFRHGTPRPAPIAVAERPWERDGWLDDRKRCWGFYRECWEMVGIRYLESLGPGLLDIPLLPHDALPLPEVKP